jgi:RNA-directed DNA polymerase
MPVITAISYLCSCVWAWVIGWIRRKHRRMNWKELRRHYCSGRMVAHHGRGHPIQADQPGRHPLPVSGNSHRLALADSHLRIHPTRRFVESRIPSNGHVRFGETAWETSQAKARHRAPGRSHNPPPELNLPDDVTGRL